jgi:hypothetical protein
MLVTKDVKDWDEKGLEPKWLIVLPAVSSSVQHLSAEHRMDAKFVGGFLAKLCFRERGVILNKLTKFVSVEDEIELR